MSRHGVPSEQVPFPVLRATVSMEIGVVAQLYLMALAHGPSERMDLRFFHGLEVTAPATKLKIRLHLK